MVNKSNKSFIFNKIIVYFLIYSFLGWCIEVVYVSALKGHWVNRGFLIGPFCCIYGFGAVLVVTFLNRIKHNAILLFIGSMVVTTFLEYYTGYFLEKAFNNKWWDYSDQPFNIAGRICLRNSLFWGAAALIAVYLIHPFVRYSTIILLRNTSFYTAYLIAAYFILDFVLSAAASSGIGISKTFQHNMPLEFESLIRFIKDFTLRSLEGIRVDISMIKA